MCTNECTLAGTPRRKVNEPYLSKSTHESRRWRQHLIRYVAVSTLLQAVGGHYLQQQVALCSQLALVWSYTQDSTSRGVQLTSKGVEYFLFISLLALTGDLAIRCK